MKLDIAAAKNKWHEMSEYENRLHQQGITLIAGIDEAGRGPLAGPVTAAAVILPVDAFIPGLDDSKKLSEKKRLLLENEIKEKSLAWACGSVNHLVIDEINIRRAAMLAMIKAVHRLAIQPQHLLIDAMELDLPMPQSSIIHGDANSVSIAAASIIAKNYRDRIMRQFDLIYPKYEFSRHKGYPTPLHKSLLREHGPSPIHRKTFTY